MVSDWGREVDWGRDVDWGREVEGGRDVEGGRELDEDRVVTAGSAWVNVSLVISKNSCDEDALEVGEEIVILNDFFAEWWVFFAEVCLGVDEGEGDTVVWLGISFDTGWINRFAII